MVRAPDQGEPENSDRAPPSRESMAAEIQKLRGYLLRYAQFHLRDTAQAEDVVQDTLLSALQHADQFAGRAKLRTWLTGILKHKIVDHVRRAGRFVALDPEPGTADGADEISAHFSADGRWEQRADRWAEPEQALDAAQFWRVYERCCGLLPSRHALVFSMREVMGMPSDEICKKLGISASNLHVILFRARLRLKACMTKNWFGKDRA